jgi:hypothetical protein
MTHQERLYKILPLSKITSKQMASLPALVETDEGIKVVITESDLWDYPGMYITGSEKSPNCLQGTFPGVALEEKRENDRNIRVTKRANYPAVTRGTRCHQLAMYVVFESPLQMLADSPSNYYREKECMEFLSKVPTVWDETKVLAAKLADYILVARKYRNEWYVGAILKTLIKG